MTDNPMNSWMETTRPLAWLDVRRCAKARALQITQQITLQSVPLTARLLQRPPPRPSQPMEATPAVRPAR